PSREYPTFLLSARLHFLVHKLFYTVFFRTNWVELTVANTVIYRLISIQRTLPARIAVNHPLTKKKPSLCTTHAQDWAFSDYSQLINQTSTPNTAPYSQYAS